MKTTRNCGSGLRQWVRLVVLAVAIAFVPRAAEAAGVRLGYYGGADADEKAFTVGVFDRWDVPGPLNLEFSADYRKEKLLGGDMEAMVIPVRASLVLNLMPVLSPYLIAGVGADFVRASFHNKLAAIENQSATLFEAHAGGGVEVTLGPFSVIGDVRYCRVAAMDNAAVNQALGHNYNPSGWYASLSAGISF